MIIAQKIILIFAPLVLVFVLAPTVASGASFPYWPTKAEPILSCTGDYAGYQDAPASATKCTSLCDILETVQRILYFMMTLVLFVGSPLMFIIGGGMIFFAGPNPEFLAKGKKTIWAAVIGVVLALSAYVIVGTFLWLIGNPKTTDTVTDPNTGQQVPAPRVSWPDINCDPEKMPGGKLRLSPINPKNVDFKYKCSGSACVRDPNGTYTNSSCDNACGGGGSSRCGIPYQGMKCFSGNDCGGNEPSGNCIGPCQKFTKPGCVP